MTRKSSEKVDRQVQKPLKTEAEDSGILVQEKQKGNGKYIFKVESSFSPEMFIELFEILDRFLLSSQISYDFS